MGSAVLGICDPALPEGGQGPSGTRVLGGDSVVFDYPVGEVLLANGVGSIGNPRKRIAVYRKFRQRGYCFITVTHPAAIVDATATLGEGAQTMAGAVVQAETVIGANAIINTSASVDHHCRIGDHVHVAPGATLSGGVEVGEAAHIGTGASVIQDIRIGRGAVVGVGVAVLADVPDNTVIHPRACPAWTG